MIKRRKHRQKNKKAWLLPRRGFTLLEIIVALFVFSIAMVAVTAIFASFVSANRTTKNTQKALEDSQQAMNIMAKTIRTSSIVTSASNKLRIFEYSQDGSPACREYTFFGSGSSARIQYAVDASSPASADKTSCSTANMTSATNVINTPTTGSFFVTPSVSKTVGKVTILMIVTAGSIQTPIQGPVSLRDYSVSK